MIEQAHQQHPELSIERLCELFDVSRSWYYERGGQPESDAEEMPCAIRSSRSSWSFPAMAIGA